MRLSKKCACVGSMRAQTCWPLPADKAAFGAGAQGAPADRQIDDVEGAVGLDQVDRGRARAPGVSSMAEQHALGADAKRQVGRSVP